MQFKSFLIYCLAMNYAILLLWGFMVMLAPDWIYNIHNKLFPIKRDIFVILHYCGIGLYKILIFIFILIPLIALHFI